MIILQISDAILKQSVLELHHNNEDQLFLVSSLCLPRSSFFDVLPLVVKKPSTLPKKTLLIELVAQIIQFKIFDLLPLTLNFATKVISRGKITVQPYGWISEILR